jgi:hypothetical protein
MKRTKALFFLMPLILLLVFLYPALARHPVSIFVLKGMDGEIEAFKISAPLNGHESEVAAVFLNSDQKKEGGEILGQKDIQQLSTFAKNFGTFAAVIGVPVTQEGWPGFMGGGVRGLFSAGIPDVFNNLQWTDRLYLALWTRQPPPAPFLSNEGGVALLPTVLTPGSAATSFSSPKPAPTPGLVRVEILNGCGITNAADWAARRVKGPGIIITDTGNADNFRYPETTVRTSAGIPVALEEAIERLGLTKDSVQEVPSLLSSVDAVVIVGKDYHKLRSRFRERNRH